MATRGPRPHSRRSRALLLAVPLLLSACSDRPPLAKEPPKPVDPPDSIRLSIAIDAGKDLSYATSSDHFAQLNGGTVSIRGLAPGVGDFEYRDKGGGARLSGRIDDRGAISVQQRTDETGDYLLFLSLLFLLPRGAIAAAPTSEDVELLPDPLVCVFGKATWTLEGEEEFLDRKARVARCETTLDIAGRRDGRLTGRLKARLSERYDAVTRTLLAVEARVRANYSNPDAVDLCPEITLLLRLRE